MINFKFFILLFFSGILFAEQEQEKKPSEIISEEHHWWNDTKDSLTYLRRGAYLQFTEGSSFVLMGAGTVTTLYYMENEAWMIERERKKHIKGSTTTASELTFALSFPLVPVATYVLGRNLHNEKLIQFSKEYFASLYLALIESGLVSIIPIHERPNKEGLTDREKKFRFTSSFPSGHMIPTSVLTFKVFQFYGLIPSLVPGFFSYVVAKERVRAGRHYHSDIIGAVFLSWLASEGTRIAAGKDTNHPLYQWMFKHHFQMNAFHEQGLWKMLFSINF